ncbi:potassium channel family protein [Halomicrobium katesii]|uniref:potassium channel family protein n=1 Tax=Halomicrobium katesii TaxID=437163 RepID=UPI000366D1A3|nr:potassium channel family protein [Halomicrobium katesii]
MACGYVADRDADRSPCPRPVGPDAERCPFHAAEAADTDVRAAVCADLRSDDERRLEYVDVELDTLDLSGLVLETDGLAAVRFRDCTISETVALSGSAVEQPIVFEGCTLGRLDASDATFEESVTITDTRMGERRDGTCLTFRRATVAGSFSLDDVTAEGSVEFASLTAESWLELDGVSVTGSAHFPNAAIERGQIVDTTFGRSVQFTGLDARRFTVERVAFERPPRFDDAVVGSLRFRPVGSVECRLAGATVDGGRLDQPDDGRACYDLTDATIGDIDLDCSSETLDRYRFYRTRFDGFPFAAYREFFRENDWRLHDYVGDPVVEADTAGLERTYLEARQGAGAVGDGENAAALFLREMGYRRRRYADHALDPARSPGHRVDAGLRWATNAALDLVAGYGERPQRTVLASIGVILGSAALYPAAGGLRDAGSVVTYGTGGASALVDALYFSVVTFTTLGYGDIEPVGGLARALAGVEAAAGAFLVALFVFALGRRATR